jgi:very-short-patch-repair endonuclease
MAQHENEKLLFEILNEAYPGQWVNEFEGIEGRKFRFDCANPILKIAIEIEGGIWLPKGGHNTGMAMERDMEKYNLATVEGWKVLRYSPQTLRQSPWKLIKDVRLLCGANNSVDKIISIDGLRIRKVEQVQVKLGV